MRSAVSSSGRRRVRPSGPAQWRVPRNTAPMKISATHLKRYKEIAQLLWKYGRSDLVREMDAEDELDLVRGEAPPSNGASPEQLADDLEAMGPTFVKLGQVLSGRPDLI